MLLATKAAKEGLLKETIFSRSRWLFGRLSFGPLKSSDCNGKGEAGAAKSEQCNGGGR